MYSISLTRIARKALALVACTGAILALTAGPVSAAHTEVLSITKAAWNAQKNQLTIEGRGETGFPVVASNAADTNQVLGSDTPGSNHRYKIVVDGPISPFPCRVHIFQDDNVEPAIVEADVTTPPPECTAQNDPPVCTIDNPSGDVQVFVGDSINYLGTAEDSDGVIQGYAWTFDGGVPQQANNEDPGMVQYLTAGTFTTTFDATDDDQANCQPPDSRTIMVLEPGGEPPALPIQTDFKMMMNYELGMHCTGFEFAYCCVLPAYNSILAQVVKPQNGTEFPHLLEADPNYNTTADVLGRHTVVRDKALDDDGNFAKYVLRYWHDAQPRNNDPNGKPQGPNRKISNVELNSLLSWNTVADAADLDADGKFKLSGADDGAGGTYPLYNGAKNVVLGNGSYDDKDVFFTDGLYGGAPFDVYIDNYQNAVWNHLYIYSDTEGSGGNTGGDALDSTKLRLGLHVGYPENFGPAGHGMEGLLTFSEDTGTVVYTQMKVLEDLPITLTSPRIWEALGLPLTPFEDSIGFFNDPGLVDEDSVRPYVEMKAALHYAENCVENLDPDTGLPTGHFTCEEGAAVLDGGGNPVIGFGTAPIDIPNCERCHSAFDTPNSPNNTTTNPIESAMVQQEINFWKAYYPSMRTGGIDWYARLKGAAVSILARHDTEHGTGFLDAYPGVECSNMPDPIPDEDVDELPPTDPTCGSLVVTPGNPGAGTNPLALAQNTRAGHESVICQKCHADNVIAVVKSANCGPDSLCEVTPADDLFENIAGNDPLTGEGHLIAPLTEALHYNHREFSEGGPIHFEDNLGRSGGCQGCHPAHRSDGDMAGYPIDLDGNNFYAGLDNRDANGGCFVGRDVHSNPTKDIDGAETPSHLNPVGQWLQTNVANDSGPWKGLWCTNCHSQAGQEMWKAENNPDLVNSQPGPIPLPGGGTAVNVREPSANASLEDVVDNINAVLKTTTSPELFKSWLDPKGKRCVGGTAAGEVCYEDGNCDGGSCVGLSADGINHTSTIWAPDPGICDYAVGYLSTGGGIPTPGQDGGVATIEVSLTGGGDCSTPVALPGPNCGGAAPAFHICGSLDIDGDFNVSLVTIGNDKEDGTGAVCGPVDGVTCFAQSNPFCTTSDCVADAGVYLSAIGGGTAFPVPMSAATDGRDHWLAPGEPHCADCHAAPYVEQSGNIDFFPPFNYPRKASLMRYSRGHQDITCQGCHESIHGLYPVTPTIDTTSYAQAASLNHDNTHGPLKCGTCHDVDNNGIPTWVRDLEYQGQPIGSDFDAAVSWMHTYTEEANPRDSVCLNCHGPKDDADISATGKNWVQHAYRGRVSRSSMDSVEIAVNGAVSGAGVPSSGDADDPLATVCVQCHQDRASKVTCDTGNRSASKWKNHLIEGRVAESVWENVSNHLVQDTCGW